MKNSSNQTNSNRNDMYKLFHYISYLNYIIYTFVGTILFWLLNVPLLFLLLTMELKISTLPFFLLAAVLVGPATTALLTYLKEAKEKDGTFKSFFKAYQEKFKMSILGWVTALLLMGVSGTNLLLMNFITSFDSLRWLNVLILIASITFSLNYFLLLSRFEITSFKQALSLTVKLSIIKSIRCSLNFMIIIGSWLLLNFIPIYLALFGVGIVGLLLLLNFEPVFEFVQKQQ